jgi:hypothetical protein
VVVPSTRHLGSRSEHLNAQSVACVEQCVAKVVDRFAGPQDGDGEVNAGFENCATKLLCLVACRINGSVDISQRTAVTQQIGQDLFEDFIRKRHHSKFGRHVDFCSNNQHRRDAVF